MTRALLPSQGTIRIVPSPTIGVVDLDCDKTVRFVAAAPGLGGVEIAEGGRVWVLEIDDTCHVVRMLSGDSRSREITDGLANKVARNAETERELAKIRAEREQLASSMKALETTRPFAVLASQAPDIARELVAFRKAFPRRKRVAWARSLVASNGTNLGYQDFELADDDWSELGQFGSRWVDPSFVTIGGADGDYLGIYVHPELLRAGSAPVVHGSHEGDPLFTLVAASLAELRDRLTAKTRTPRAKAIDPATRRMINATEDSDLEATPERLLVRKLLWGVTPEFQDDAAAQLEALYASNGHTFGRMRITGQRQQLGLDARARVLDQDENELLRFDRDRY